MKRQLKVILIGAGARSEAYTDIMAQMPDRFQVTAVAEPIDSRRNAVQKKHGIPDSLCFTDWKPLLDLGKIADVAIIATMDRQHFEPAMKAISLGYDLLLEKPVSPDPAECLQIARHAEKMGVRVVVCHVLRYTPFFITIKRLIDDGRLGDIVSINHEECVGNVHQSHSFVRGNWGNSERSSFMLLQKSCHDIDILQWLVGKRCLKVQSFGSLSHFTEKNAPEGAPQRCIDGCPAGDTCPYNAVKLYLDDKHNSWFRTTCTREADPTDEMVEKALRTTQYGKCVYRCDNDVVDHQTVNMLFEGGVTVTFTMNAFNKGGRFIHIMGTKGELHGAMEGGGPVSLYDFETKATTQIPLMDESGRTSGHGGGDEGIVTALYEYLTGSYKGCSISDIGVSVDNHLTVFAAEQSRLTGQTVDMDEYAQSVTGALHAGKYAQGDTGAPNAGKYEQDPARHYTCFSNKDCEYFPCHDAGGREDFNCLFCYCPLYALGKDCGGNFKYLPNGRKDCSGCIFPHLPENYDAVAARYSQIMDAINRNEDAHDSDTPKDGR